MDENIFKVNINHGRLTGTKYSYTIRGHVVYLFYDVSMDEALKDFLIKIITDNLIPPYELESYAVPDFVIEKLTPEYSSDVKLNEETFEVIKKRGE